MMSRPWASSCLARSSRAMTWNDLIRFTREAVLRKAAILLSSEIHKGGSTCSSRVFPSPGNGVNIGRSLQLDPGCRRYNRLLYQARSTVDHVMIPYRCMAPQGQAACNQPIGHTTPKDTGDLPIPGLAVI